METAIRSFCIKYNIADKCEPALQACQLMLKEVMSAYMPFTLRITHSELSADTALDFMVEGLESSPLRAPGVLPRGAGGTHLPRLPHQAGAVSLVLAGGRRGLYFWPKTSASVSAFPSPHRTGTLRPRFCSRTAFSTRFRNVLGPFPCKHPTKYV